VLDTLTVYNTLNSNNNKYKEFNVQKNVDMRLIQFIHAIKAGH